MKVSTVYHNEELGLIVVRYRTTGGSVEGQAAFLYDWEVSDDVGPEYEMVRTDEGSGVYLNRINSETSFNHDADEIPENIYALINKQVARILFTY